MKIIIETGSGSHTSSYASCQAKFYGGEYDGQFLYQQRQFKIAEQWKDIQGERWVVSQYELPEGTEIEIIGKGRTGARGSTRHDFHRVYRLDHEADVLEETINVGLRQCLLKGRLVLVKDLLQQQRKQAKVNTEEGF